MKKNYLVTSIFLSFFLCASFLVSAQQNVFSRSEVTTGNFGDGQLPWFYQTSNNSQGDPDNGNSTRNFVKIGHNNNTTMTTNGRFYLVNTLDFEAGATSARTINNSGGGLSASGGIYNASSATHTFNTPIGIDGTTVQLHANSTGGLNFTNTIFINNNTVQFGNTGTGNISVSGAMQGTGNVQKVGSNTLTISGTNTYTGTTTVSGGTLILQSDLTTSDVTVVSGATLEIDGDITLKSLTINSGGTVTVSASDNLTITGNLNNSGTLALNSDSTNYASLIVSGTSTGDIMYNRFVNSNILGNDLVAPPVDGQTWASFLDPVNATALLDDGGAPTTSYAFGPFNKTTGAYENYNNSTSAILNAGTGYRAATDSGETLAFNGTVETGTVSVDIQHSGPEFVKWNLIGNPYPSYINVQDFLSHEVSTGVTNLDLFESSSAAIYGYDGDASNGWTVYNLANTTASTVITPGQGFFVSADATNASLYDLEFTPAMRTSGSDDDFINGRGGLIYFTLLASGGGDSYSTDVYFNPNASLAFNFGFDAELFSSPAFVLYSELVEINSGTDPTMLSLQAINTTDLADTTIPLGVRSDQGVQLTFTITANTLPATTELWLEDTEESTMTLLNSSDYIVTPNVNLDGTGRFYLRVFDPTLSIQENNLETLSIFALNKSKEIVVKGQLQDNSVLSLYDIQGRKIVTTTLDNTIQDNRIDVSSLSSGVYVVNVQNDSQQKSQKVIIK